ncbi:pyridine nucleotide-disulfide oxidoreductase dimerization region [Mycolicibacterium canariasense]|uniref:Pyridine nucleotide-disulfide oxidoreductase dimerization region n=1 Tax=Mycolicibacterium canariasense TaxID=228230 RepID=A0A100WH76_MYCCR|nr:FAD-dependent oxidoreductase [Mycolicibacterium canariasense]MCV7212401.1 FAD-dependent oxidoreductase [Mycolicibacterium canariasense]ORV15530.1 pyridine nucleotide-disulfide oxidoreductase [Mycolicibacterium canariasense]GAS98026.1 pyridine nucleotide-disulfide oxidoreductase dimerization region [Mycolicibacterium canariasense]
MSDRQVDLAVIGFGKGGKTLAAALGRKGWRVAMIEQSAQMYGGTCINIGCVPTKSMVYRSEHLGTDTAHPDEYRRAVTVTGELTAGLRAVNYTMIDGIPTAEVLTGSARFLDEHTLAVTTAEGEVTVSAKWIVIGTGSRPTLPDIPGLATSPRVHTSTDLLTEQNLPARLVVLGGGYVGLEFAAMYATYGSEVTVLDRHGRVLAREDDDIAEAARTILQDKGIRIITDAEVTAVDDGTVSYRVGDTVHTVDADAILVALGREPVTAELDLAAAGVDTTPSGAVAVDEQLRSSRPHIFAMGDVNGGPQFTYVSLDDYRIVLDQLVGDGARSTADRKAVPYNLFITPPLGRVGLTEREARATGLDIKVAAMDVARMATVPRARIVDEPQGRMKVVVDAQTDLILGAALLCYDAHEVINTVALAMRHGITATALRDSIYTHPSMTEAFNQLLGSL